MLLLAGVGLGFVLVHCERTCVERCDNVDHHHTTFHNRCSWSDSSATHPHVTHVRVIDAASSGVKALAGSVVRNCSIQSATLMIPSAAPQTAQTQKWILRMRLVFHTLIQSSALQTLVTKDSLV